MAHAALGWLWRIVRLMSWVKLGVPSPRLPKTAAPWHGKPGRKFTGTETAKGKVMKQPDLDERIANAFKDGAKSEDFEPLLRDVEAASSAATAASARARTRALDPTLRAAEAATARRESDDATFASDRLQAATVRLRDRHKQVSAAEENARRVIAYNEAIAARDVLAEELKQKYPTLVAQLVELLTRMHANNNEVARVNNRLPDGGSRVLDAELVARGLSGFPLGTSAISIVEGTRLPNFVSDVHKPYAYIVSDVPMTATVMPIRA